MSKRGENIYKRKDNRWEGRYIKGRDAGGKAILGYVYAGSYREVKEKLLAARQKGTQSRPIKENFGFFCDEWLTLSRNRVKDSTFAKYHNVIARHLKPYFGGWLPQELSTVAIERFSNALLVEGLSPKTVRDILCVLKSVLHHCRRQSGGGLPDVEIVYPKESKTAMRVLSAEEQNTLVRYLLTDVDTAKFGVLLALFTGMRIGEVCALKWGSISARDGTVAIAETMQRLPNTADDAAAKTKVVVGGTKSDASTRVVPLTDTTMALCERMRREDGAYVLTGETARFMEPRALQYRFAKYVEDCGLEGVNMSKLSAVGF